MNSTPFWKSFWCAGAILVLASCAVPPAPATQRTTPSPPTRGQPPPHRPTDSTRTLDSTTVAPPETLLVAPRPTVFIAGQNLYEVRTKLVPRVMGRGWTLLVNKSDSLEFFRPADSILTTALFGLSPEPGQRLRLRFRLTSEGSGTWIALMGHLVGKEGELPNIAYEHPLAANLTALQEDLLAAPPTQSPQRGGKRRR